MTDEEQESKERYEVIKVCAFSLVQHAAQLGKENDLDHDEVSTMFKLAHNAMLVALDMQQVEK